MLQNGGWGPQRCHSMIGVDNSLSHRLDDNGHHDCTRFKLLWLKLGNKALAHESTQHAIVHRRRVLRDVTCMMHVFGTVVAVDGCRL